MDPSSEHQHQEMQSHNSLDMVVCSSKSQQQGADQRNPRPQPEQALRCPRCDSTNTKFCYYNNYSLTQPRYFCKSCRRYWTKGGTLRNVPVGGGCRKNKRSSSKRASQEQPLTPNGNNNNPMLPALTYDSHDLSLAFARLQRSCGAQLGFDEHHLSGLGIIPSNDIMSNSSSATPSPGFLDALRTGFSETSHNSNGFHNNLYYGFGSNGGNNNHNNNNMVGEVEMVNGVCGEMGLHQYEEMSNAPTATAVTVTTMKQEFDNNMNSRVLWGFPWQMNNGDHHNLNMGGGDAHHEYDNSGREIWNGLANPSWHGLLPLV